MAKLHRKDLKQDEVREKFAEAIRSVSLHGREVLYIVLVVVAVALTAAAWFYYERRQQEQAQNLLSIAMEKYQASVSEAPPAPGAPRTIYTYKTEPEKYSAAMKDFEEVIKKYGNTPAADMARYQAGVCAFYLKDYKKAEDYLQQSAKTSDRNILYYESRLALANLYNLTNRPQQAVTVLNDAVEKNKSNVPADYLMLQLGENYAAAGNVKAAKDTYQKILNQYKDSPIGYQAQIKLNEMNRK